MFFLPFLLLFVFFLSLFSTSKCKQVIFIRMGSGWIKLSLLQCILFLLKFSNIRIYIWNGEAGSLICTGKAFPRWTVIHKEQERNEKTEEKPVSLSDSEVKWMFNLLSRETHCKQRSCVCIVVVSCCMLNDSLTGQDWKHCSDLLSDCHWVDVLY